jgi:lipopolysaccharide transport system permease protein
VHRVGDKRSIEITAMKSWNFFPVFLKHGSLIEQFLRRDIAGRYKGTTLGPLLSLLVPVLMLVIYTFVFGTIFNSRFGYSTKEGVFDFGLGLFCGLNLFNFLSEVVTRSPNLILQYPNYVKKVVFPLEIFPITTVGAALFHYVVASIPLLVGFVIIDHRLPFGCIWLFIISLPLALLALGMSWILSALGVFVRDISALLPPALTIVMFGSGIFYPMNAVPPFARPFLALNPLALLVDCARQALFLNRPPGLFGFSMLVLLGIFLAAAGYAFFLKAKPAFADVI